MKKTALFLVTFILIGISLVSVTNAFFWRFDYSLPKSMAAMGDSMTQAVNIDGDSLGNNPEHSW